MVLIPINPEKVKVGRLYYTRRGRFLILCRIVSIHQNGYKVADMETGRLLPKLRTAEDLMLRRRG